jgi:hypothetical protein
VAVKSPPDGDAHRFKGCGGKKFTEIIDIATAID